MKRTILLTTALASVLALSGCNTYNPQDRAVGGALLGGATGAAIGGLAGGNAGSAVAGGLIGAAAGGIIGASTTPQRPRRRCAEFVIDDWGRRHCVSWYY
jgi:outer membrane lipoprotein SlyB